MAEKREAVDLRELRELRRQLEIYNRAYYDEDAPLVDDAEYDLLMRRLRELEALCPDLERHSSPTQKVGGTAASGLARIPHLYPMLSLQDVFSLEEVEGFHGSILKDYPEAVFSVEEKIDGLSLGIRYRNGEFELAHTRGDGHSYGENVSANAREILDLPLRCDPSVSSLFLRAEVYMSREVFERVNREQEEAGKALFANPRNAAAGTLRQLDPFVTRSRGLRCFIFDLVHSEGKSFRRDSEALDWLREQGFPVISRAPLCRTREEIETAIAEIAQRRPGLAYGIDGAVLKVDQLELREELGATAKTPRWAVAFKYPPEAKESIVEDIQVQVGRTGKITPLAILKPVFISGSTVSRASLHNQAIIDALDIRVGDHVMVSKSGDIIPMIVSVLKEKRPEGTKAFKLPMSCPVCGAPAASRDDSVDVFCEGSDCPAQLSRRLQYFASKAAMDIDGLGEQSVENLSRMGWLKSLGDIYELHLYRENLILDGRIGKERRVDNLLAAIEASKNNEAWRLLTGLGIRNVGPQTAKSLMARFLSLEALAAADREELLQVEEIGETVADSIMAYFAQASSQELLRHFKKAGLQLSSSAVLKSDAQTLAGLRFVLTGSLPGKKRAEVQALIEEAGGSVASSVSAKTDYVLAGEDAGSKLEKARQLGVPILDWQAFEQLLEGKL